VRSHEPISCPLGCPRPELKWQFADGVHSIKRCLCCSIVFVPSGPGLQSLYDAAYFEQKYTRPINSGYINANVAQKKMLGYLRRASSLCQGLNGNPGAILDVGCGTGRFLELAQKEGWTTQGLELFPGIAQETAARLGIKVSVSSILETDLPSQSCDVISMFDVIEHIEEPVRALEICERILKPGGVLILTTPNFNGLGRRMMGKDAFAIWPDEHLIYFRPSTLRKALELAGFSHVEMSTRDIYPENVAMFLNRLRGREQAISSRPTGTEESVLSVKSMARGRVMGRLRSLTNRIFSHILWGDELLAFAKKA
jgi:2-polyprenyl-3-methyl-5-hydroxy-6-metoxy-1,4-benzoquinol methylase